MPLGGPKGHDDRLSSYGGLLTVVNPPFDISTEPTKRVNSSLQVNNLPHKITTTCGALILLLLPT